MSLLLAAEQFPPPVRELFEFAPLFGEGTPFAFNRVSLLYLVAAAVTIGLVVGAFRQPKLIPDRFQAAMEAVVEFVRDQIVMQVIGPAGLRYVPLLVTLLVFIFINNLFEIVPLIQFPTTGRMALPALLAVMVWTLFVLVGFKNQGVRYLKNVVAPPGVPAPILVLVAPIELVSTFIVRPFTLAVRLFANMMAGHILLSIIFVAANSFLLDFHGIYDGLEVSLAAGGVMDVLLGLVLILAGAIAVAFELMVAGLQAYIFTILTAVYLGGSIEPEH